MSAEYEPDSQDSAADEQSLDLGLEPVTLSGGSDYQVLARKYRPTCFEELIGQEAMVRTLRNAFESGRIAHAFILTGVRGVGKTTTARIIARALNYEGPDGNEGPSVDMASLGAHCQAIMESRHVDVLEMDAASRTGIDDIREIIESVRYAPVSARHKVYIIDEVHMLSKAAFNGLLKTLEEPPPHVKFIFATTEIRKVPVTILSRCQRFDLKRIDAEVLADHLQMICEKEGAQAEPSALALIARAAEGSARDGLSLLDQAIAHGSDVGDSSATVQEAEVRGMLGLADRNRILDLFDLVMRGEVSEALGELNDQYMSGADPLIILQDLIEFTHWLTRLKLAPGSAVSDVSVNQAEQQRGAEMAKRLPVKVLTRTWQMLLKGLHEVQTAPRPIAAAEMLLVRLAYAADLPTPDEVIRDLRDSDTGNDRTTERTVTRKPSLESNGNAPLATQTTGATETTGTTEVTGGPPPSGVADSAMSQPFEVRSLALDQQPSPRAEMEAVELEARDARDNGSDIRDFEALVAFCGERRDVKLKTALERFVHLVAFEPGHIEMRLAHQAPKELIPDLTNKLQQWTGKRWIISIASDPSAGTPTRREQTQTRDSAIRREVENDPLITAAMETFPDAKIVEVRDRYSAALDEASDQPHEPDSEGEERDT